MYFVSKDNKKEGPLSLEEVKRLKLTEDILVWKEGMSNWVNIKEIDELKDLIIITPPPLPSELKLEEDKEFEKFRLNKTKQILLRNGLIGLVVGIIFSVNHYYQATHSSGEGIDNLFPIYLTREERDNPFLIFWHILPYTLLLVQIIMLLVSGFQIYNIKKTDIKKNERTSSLELSESIDNNDSWFISTIIVLILITIIIIAFVYEK